MIRRSALLLAFVGCTQPTSPLTEADRARLDAVPCAEVDELNSVYFESGSAALDGEQPTAPGQTAGVPFRLGQNLYLLARCPGLTVQIRGYTTDREAGVARANRMDLSQRRADAVRAYYLRRGLDPDRVSASLGMGEDPSSKPVYADTVLYELDRQRSRRADSFPAQPSEDRETRPSATRRG